MSSFPFPDRSNKKASMDAILQVCTRPGMIPAFCRLTSSFRRERVMAALIRIRHWRRDPVNMAITSFCGKNVNPDFPADMSGFTCFMGFDDLIQRKNLSHNGFDDSFLQQCGNFRQLFSIRLHFHMLDAYLVFFSQLCIRESDDGDNFSTWFQDAVAPFQCRTANRVENQV